MASHARILRFATHRKRVTTRAVAQRFRIPVTHASAALFHLVYAGELRFHRRARRTGERWHWIFTTTGDRNRANRQAR